MECHAQSAKELFCDEYRRRQEIQMSDLYWGAFAFRCIEGKKDEDVVFLQGEIKAVAHPPHGFTPYGGYATASLYPRKGRVKYLKFRTSLDLDRSGLKPGYKVQVEGCSHDVDGEELVFDIRDVRFDPAT